MHEVCLRQVSRRRQRRSSWNLARLQPSARKHVLAEALNLLPFSTSVVRLDGHMVTRLDNLEGRSVANLDKNLNKLDDRPVINLDKLDVFTVRHLISTSI